MRETLNEKLSKFRVNPFIPSPFPFSPCAALLFSSQPPPPSQARPPSPPVRLPTTAAKPPPATLSQAATQHAAVAPNPQIGPNPILQQLGINRHVTDDTSIAKCFNSQRTQEFIISIIAILTINNCAPQ